MAIRSGCKSPVEVDDTNHQVKGNCVVVRRGGKEAGGEIAIRGTRTGLEAWRSGRASNARSPMSSRGRYVSAAGARGRWLVLSREISTGVSGCLSTLDVIVGWDGPAGVEGSGSTWRSQHRPYC